VTGEVEPDGLLDQQMIRLSVEAEATHIPEQVEVDVEGVGRVLFCHGSPRSDEELVTPETPARRVREFTTGIPERVIVSAHTHLQFDRRVEGVRLVNPGSVGMPYEGRPGAYWAVLGPDVSLRRTDYPLEEAVERYRSSGDPLAEQMVELLMSPPTRDEVIEDAERRKFAG
jgi:predicted phosphodiesterase